MRCLELLAPAKDVSCGRAAVDCGADAVYIGAPRYGARVSAGNSIADIAALVTYAHQYDVKVYVTLNTIVYDSELDDMQRLIEALQAIHVDAFIVQDMALTALVGRESTPLHASTQCDNSSIARVALMQRLGMSRVVLAREMTIDEIRAVHHALPDMELEAFVHGALCVSHSGRCYASEYLFSRSANRGCCAQVCRMPFDLVDSRESVIRTHSHLLSLRDLCLLPHLEHLADAGVTAFKIEGRLKDIAYVRNVVSAYSLALDTLCQRRKDDYCRAAIGHVTYSFTPDVAKTFNRGYTSYFLYGRQGDITSMDTPKVRGEAVGRVKDIRRNTIVMSTTTTFSNGDGLTFFTAEGTLAGFRVNRAEGNQLTLYKVPSGLRKGMTLYRNSDVTFSKTLARSVATRRIPLLLTLTTTADGFSLRGESPRHMATATVIFPHELARKPQRDYLLTQLQRWGNTIYEVTAVRLEGDVATLFLPASVLATLRQQLAETLLSSTKTSARGDGDPSDLAAEALLSTPKTVAQLPEPTPHSAADPAQTASNVANKLAEEVYHAMNIHQLSYAPEVTHTFSAPLMTCHHCLRYTLGHCTRHGGTAPLWHEPLFLRLDNGARLRLAFDCTHCVMTIHPA